MVLSIQREEHLNNFALKLLCLLSVMITQKKNPLEFLRKEKASAFMLG